jgi:hypothetical protein
MGDGDAGLTQSLPEGGGDRLVANFIGDGGVEVADLSSLGDEIAGDCVLSKETKEGGRERSGLGQGRAARPEA